MADTAASVAARRREGRRFMRGEVRGEREEGKVRRERIEKEWDLRLGCSGDTVHPDVLGVQVDVIVPGDSVAANVDMDKVGKAGNVA